jgi:hypothetical protein
MLMMIQGILSKEISPERSCALVIQPPHSNIHFEDAARLIRVERRKSRAIIRIKGK